MAEQLRAGEIELVVSATDVSDLSAGCESREWELVYSSRTTEPAELAQAILASAAISGLVLPMPVGDRLATDGGWTRNFPLGHAYDRPEVGQIVAFRYVPRYARLDIAGLVRLRRRLERFGRVPPVRALVAELREAEERERRGEPPHVVDTLLRLMRIAVVHNTELEERLARQKDESIAELARLRNDVATLLHRRPRLARAVDERFAAARFPFRHDRLVPRVIVRGSAEELSLEAGGRGARRWSREEKLALIQRGYELTDRELEAHGFSSPVAA
jgi:predicted acylesterase/phospholipase RssA